MNQSNCLDAPFVREMVDIAGNMYRLGWDERNGGNISLLLEKSEIAPYLSRSLPQGEIPLPFNAGPLAGCCFLVTGSGKYFKNIPRHPAENLGIIRITGDGCGYQILWGFEGGAEPTSELSTHLMNHIERLKADPQHRVVMHCHPANILAMTYVHELDDRAFTRTLWRMSTECIVVFPDGVGVLPWMVCGNTQIGRATAQKIGDCRVVLWAAHGIFGTGRDLDETFGLIETVEKAAEIYIKIGGMPIQQSITDTQLSELCKAFGLTPREGYLDV